VSVRRTKVPKKLYVVITDPGNPHAEGDVVLYRRKRNAERACKWGGQKLVTYVPERAPSTSPFDPSRFVDVES
jgi:hypothetical protein